MTPACDDSTRIRSRRHLGALLTLPLLLVALTLTTGCDDDTEIVEVPRAVFNDPPDAVNNFLGYFEADEKLTACGNCHVGQQSDWETTAHADAWAGLQNSGHAQEFCEGCHTVSELGNPLEEAAGYNLVADPQYEDVQCESCHGSGFEHVQNPDATQPLASLAAGVDLTDGCSDCHQGTHHPFTEQWEQSRHGTIPAGGIAAGRESCAVCHEGKAALVAKFGETDDFVEKGDADPLPITCGVCHDPHGSSFEGQLRADITAPSLDNFCVLCHARRGTPPSSHGPHAAQGLMVLGENVGWIPEGFAYDTARIIGTHGTTANPRLCATCHVTTFDVTDAETGEFQLTSVGHTFEAIQCLDAQGLPTEGPCPDTERNFEAGCTESGCHGTADAARSAFTVVKLRLNDLLDDLWVDTDDDHVMDETDGGLLPQVVAQGDTSQLDVTDDVVTVAEGALWNAMLAYTSERTYFGDGEVFGIHFGAHKASGEGVHNPFLLEALLIASIDAVVDEYGLAPPPAPQLEPQLKRPPGWVKVR